MGFLDFFISSDNGEVVDSSNWSPNEILSALEGDEYISPGKEDVAAVVERGKDIIFEEYDESSSWFGWW